MENQQVDKVFGEKWDKMDKVARMKVILATHTFPAVLNKNWADINPKLQKRLASFVVVDTKPSPSHVEMQWLLLKLGSDMGFYVWVARNDLTKRNAEIFNTIPNLLKELPIKLLAKQVTE